MKCKSLLFFPAMLLSVLLLASCSGDSTSPAGSTDATAPTLINTIPLDAATGVPIDTPIVVIFDEPLEPASVNSANIYLDGVAATVDYVEGSQVVDLVPLGELDYDTTYTVHIGTGVTDRSHNPLASAASYTFTTQTPPVAPDTTAPTVVYTIPVAASYKVLVGTPIVVIFDEPLDPATVNSTNIYLDEITTTVEYLAGSQLVNLIPQGELAYDTTYSLHVGTGVTDRSANALAVPFTLSFDTEVDIYPPHIVSTSPAADATGVAVDTTVTIVFSEDISPSTQYFYVYGKGATGTWSYDSATYTATFTSSADFYYGEQYRIQVPYYVTDLAGNQLGTTFQVYFTTIPDTTAPEVVSTSPVDTAVDVDALATVSATFNEAMALATVDETSFLLDGVTGTVSYDVTTKTATFTAVPRLPYATTVTARLTTGITDYYGNPMAEYSWFFTTGADLIAPTVVSTVPLDGQPLVGSDSSIKVTFSEPMDGATLAGNFTIADVTGTTSYDAATFTATFTPDAPLPYDTDLSVEVNTSVTDSQGLPLAAPFGFGFTTAGAAETISLPTSALHSGARMATNSDGDIMAAWVVSAANLEAMPIRKQEIILYSIYSATSQTWSEEALLPRETNTGGVTLMAVAGSGSTFAVAYFETSPKLGVNYRFNTVIFDGQSWGETTTHAFKSPRSAKLVGSTSGYAMAWGVYVNSLTSKVFVSVHEAGQWTESEFLTKNYQNVGLASNGTTYLFAYLYNTQASYRYYTYDGGVWTYGGYLRSASGVIPSNLELISNGTSYAAVWEERSTGFPTSPPNIVYGAVNNGAGFSATAVGDSEGVPDHKIATDGSTYMVASRFNGLYSSYITSRLYETAIGWSAYSTISAVGGYNIEGLSGDNGTYVVAWNTAIAGALEANIFTAGSWGTPEELDASRAGEAEVIVFGGVGQVLWTGLDSAGAYWATHDGINWQAATDLAAAGPVTDLLLYPASSVAFKSWSSLDDVNVYDESTTIGLALNAYEGSVGVVDSAHTATGETMVVWEQYDLGERVVYAAVRSGGSWLPATLVSAEGRNPRVATSGTDFMVVWESSTGEGSEADHAIKCCVYNIAGDSWGSELIVRDPALTNQVMEPAIAHNGSTYLVAWAEFSGRYVYASTSTDGQVWETPHQTYSNSYLPIMVSAGGKTVLSFESGNRLFSVVHDGASWGFPVQMGNYYSSSYPIYQHAQADNGTDIAVVWQYSSSVYSKIYDTTDAGSWGGLVQVSGVGSASSPRIAADSSGGFMLLWETSNSDYSSQYVGGSWAPQLEVTTPSIGPFVHDTTGYVMLHQQDDGAFIRGMSAYNPDGNWSGDVGTIPDSDGDITPVELLWANSEFLGVFKQKTWFNDVVGSFWGR